MILVNGVGRTVEIEDEDLALQYLAKGRMRHATDEEQRLFVLSQNERNSRAATIVSDKREVFFSTVASSADGYGMSRGHIKNELFDIGRVLSETYQGQKIGLLYGYPYGAINMQNDVRIVYTMFESDKIPADWPEYLSAADEVLVPCAWCHDVFKKFGVETTIVPLGYNHRLFTYIEREVPVNEHKDFTFIHYNSFNIRKGFNEVLVAFTEEFEAHEPVKLILKTTTEMPVLPIIKSQYPNIEVIRGAVSESELISILGRAHCMVYPSRGEGFGITPLEAMATGMPAIVPNAHGISEYFNANYMLEVAADGRCPGLYNRFKGQDTGEMVVCDVADLRKKMRHAYNHQEEMKELGKKASEYVKRWTYAETAKKLEDIFAKWDSADVPKRKESKFLLVEKL